MAGFITQSKDAALIDVCENILIEWASLTLSTEATWAGGSAQVTGYNKRLTLARAIIETRAKLHSHMCAALIAQMFPSIVTSNNNTFTFLNFATGNKAMDCVVGNNIGFTFVGNTTGTSVSDVLAGVNQTDIV